MTFETVLDLVDAHGPRVIESWVCEKCQTHCWMIHPNDEVVVCCLCGQRRASAMPRYRDLPDPDNG